MNPRCAPSRVFRNHLKDQGPYCFRGASPPNRSSRFGDQPPIQPEPSPMPPDHCLWCDDNERLFPAGPESSRQDPADLIESGEPWPRTSSLQRNKLLTESEIFKKQATTSAEQAKERATNESKDVRHPGVAIAFYLWNATLYPIEITSGQSFGERHPSNEPQRS